MYSDKGTQTIRELGAGTKVSGVSIGEGRASMTWIYLHVQMYYNCWVQMVKLF